MKTRTGIVTLSGKRVGIIEETRDGSRFTYDADWLNNPKAVPISVTLPLGDEPFQSRGLHPFFSNLLPEGWLLEIASKSLKLSKDDGFGLLLATCTDCIGAIEIADARGAVENSD